MAAATASGNGNAAAAAAAATATATATAAATAILALGYGGFVVRDIAIAGRVDITIDAVQDSATIPTTGTGIGITFTNSDLNFRLGDMGFSPGFRWNQRSD